MVVKKTIPKIQKEKKPKEPQKSPIPEVFLKPKEPSPSNKPSDVLKHYWGFDSFRPFQEEIINSVITGNDVFVVAPTSFGKSSVFQVPTMCMEGITIVISPLIALQADQVTNSQAIGIPAACLNSELGIKEKRTLLHLLQNKLVKLLYVAPETFFSEGFVPFYETLKQQKMFYLMVIKNGT